MHYTRWLAFLNNSGEILLALRDITRRLVRNGMEGLGLVQGQDFRFMDVDDTGQDVPPHHASLIGSSCRLV